MAYRDERRAKRRRLKMRYRPSQRVRSRDFVAWTPIEPEPSAWRIWVDRRRIWLERIGETLMVPIWLLQDVWSAWFSRRNRVE